MLINHLGRLFVTSDAATIIREIEVVHPAAKLLVMASQAQESEVCCIVLLEELIVDDVCVVDGRFNKHGAHIGRRIVEEI